ncbi:MAG: adenylosuccinate synthetase, partial [Promethearchaeota archaeon]
MLKMSQGEQREKIEKLTSMDTVLTQISEYASFLEKYMEETSIYINEQLDANKKVLFEGAQGAMLDIDFGTYPYCTSSSPTAGSVCTGAGVPPSKISRIIGIFKAYTTRVGTGPFPTELLNDEAELGEQIAQVGKEFGTVTGRKRRVGWLDIPALRHAIRINGCTELTMMKIDVLSGIPTIKVCTEFEFENKNYDSFPADLRVLNNVKPIYCTFEGWSEILGNELPSEAEKYIQFVENELQVPIKTVSVGPERTQTIHRM